MNCQRCRTPLRLDSSLENINPAAYDLVVATHSQQNFKRTPAGTLHPHEISRRLLYDQVSKNAGPPTFKRNSGPGRTEGPAMSFVLLTESQVASPAQAPSSIARTTGEASAPGALHGVAPEDDEPHEMERITKLFEILSARSDIDHPICVECTELLVEEMQKKLEVTARERDAYVSFLKEMQANAPAEEEIRAQKEALEKAQKEEAQARQEIMSLEREKTVLDDEVLALEEESKRLDEEEEAFWQERNAFANKLANFQSERDSINTKFDHDSRLLEKLRRSNVYNDTFTISYDGYFGTINSLRLGRSSDRPVEWAEINAAMGHALLLLVTVADKLGYKFEGHEPQPLGSTSRIIRLEPVYSKSSSRLSSQRSVPPPPPPPKRHVLELYSSGDMPLGLAFLHRKFDNAMVAFLELIRQLAEHLQKQQGLSLPFKIEGDRIGGASIKIGGSQDETWTRACKRMLTCCKFLLAHTSLLNSSNGQA